MMYIQSIQLLKCTFLIDENEAMWTVVENACYLWKASFKGFLILTFGQQNVSTVIYAPAHKTQMILISADSVLYLLTDNRNCEIISDM